MKPLLSALAIATMCVGCGKHERLPEPTIEGVTLENFPVMDGSTSTDPLVRVIASRLLGYEYEWKRDIGYSGAVMFVSTTLPHDFIQQKLLCSQTNGAIVNLIDGGADIVFSARSMSEDEKAHAATAGVTVIETPVALDALVFIKNIGVGVTSLTHRQLQDVYTGRTTNWNELDGDDMPIVPFVRNRNSGSQELMESLVMKGEPIADGLQEDMINSMFPLLMRVAVQEGGLGYTVYYYLTSIVQHDTRQYMPMIAVDGVIPGRETIGDRSYPFTAEVYMMIRDDLDRQSSAWEVYEFLQSAAGQGLIAESGYVPIR